jgi:hypothetical protein
MNNNLEQKKAFYASIGITKETQFGYFADGYRQFNDQDFDEWLMSVPGEEEYKFLRIDRSHQSKRATEYPDVKDQLDVIYKTFAFLKESGINLGEVGETWVSQISAIKAKYPKPDQSIPLDN